MFIAYRFLSVILNFKREIGDIFAALPSTMKLLVILFISNRKHLQKSLCEASFF